MSSIRIKWDQHARRSTADMVDVVYMQHQARGVLSWDVDCQQRLCSKGHLVAPILACTACHACDQSEMQHINMVNADCLHPHVHAVPVFAKQKECMCKQQ